MRIRLVSYHFSLEILDFVKHALICLIRYKNTFKVTLYQLAVGLIEVFGFLLVWKRKKLIENENFDNINNTVIEYLPFVLLQLRIETIKMLHSLLQEQWE